MNDPDKYEFYRAEFRTLRDQLISYGYVEHDQYINAVVEMLEGLNAKIESLQDEVGKLQRQLGDK